MDHTYRWPSSSSQLSCPLVSGIESTISENDADARSTVSTVNNVENVGSVTVMDIHHKKSWSHETPKSIHQNSSSSCQLKWSTKKWHSIDTKTPKKNQLIVTSRDKNMTKNSPQQGPITTSITPLGMVQLWHATYF